MKNKNRLRKKYFLIRKKKYYDIKPSFFLPLIKLIKKKFKKKQLFLSSYYPSSYEVNTTKLFEIRIFNKLKIFLPVVKENNSMHFYEWEKNDVLKINQFGMLEPAFLSGHIVPDIMLVPLLAYDNLNNRLGYGGGFYDRYIKNIKLKKKIVTIGLAYSFQKVEQFPVNKHDVRLDLIITNKDK